MNSRVFDMVLVRSTKNTHVYGDDSDGAIVPTLYVKKAGLPDKPPEMITVTVEYDGAQS